MLLIRYSELCYSLCNYVTVSTIQNHVNVYTIHNYVTVPTIHTFLRLRNHHCVTVFARHNYVKYTLCTIVLVTVSVYKLPNDVTLRAIQHCVNVYSIYNHVAESTMHDYVTLPYTLNSTTSILQYTQFRYCCSATGDLRALLVAAGIQAPGVS